MTEKYDPYSNAVAERVNGILKGEFGLEENDLAIDLLKKIVAESAIAVTRQRKLKFCHEFECK